MKDFLTRAVLGTDGSEDAALAARVAVDLCDKTGAELHVVHVWQSTPVLFPAPVTILKSGLPSEKAARLLKEQVERIESIGGQVQAPICGWAVRPERSPAWPGNWTRTS